MMDKISICMPFYRNGPMLRIHQRAWAGYPESIRKRLRVIIVDDGSPDLTALEHVDRDVDYALEIYRVLVNIPWHQNGARNLAMDRAPEGWCLVTDFDHVLEPDDARKLWALKKNGRCFYVPARRRAVDGKPYHRHPNSYVLTRELFWETGGCDEDFCGTYGSDSTFRRAINALARRVEVVEPVLTLYGREVVPEASTVDWGRKDSEFHSSRFPALNKKKFSGAYLASNPLRFPWERVL